MKIRQRLSGKAAAAGNTYNVSIDFICRNLTNPGAKLALSDSPGAPLLDTVTVRTDEYGNASVYYRQPGVKIGVSRQFLTDKYNSMRS